MFDKLLGFALTALPGVAGFMVYGLTQKKMGPVASAALAGAAFAATDIGGKLLSGGISGLTLEQVGALTLNPSRPAWPALTRAQQGNLGYLSTEKVGACFGSC